MHFFNIWLFSKMGRDRDLGTPSKPPVYAEWNLNQGNEKPSDA